MVAAAQGPRASGNSPGADVELEPRGVDGAQLPAPVLPAESAAELPADLNTAPAEAPPNPSPRTSTRSVYVSRLRAIVGAVVTALVLFALGYVLFSNLQR